MIGSTYKIAGWEERIGFNGRLTVVNCCNCGIVYAIPEEVQRRLLRFSSDSYPNNYASTTCPNGHGWHYTEDEEGKSRRRAEQAERELATARQQRDEARAETARVTKESARLAKRIHSGVCLHCNRTFQNVARHMQSKHASPSIKEEGVQE